MGLLKEELSWSLLYYNIYAREICCFNSMNTPLGKRPTKDGIGTRELKKELKRFLKLGICAWLGPSKVKWNYSRGLVYMKVIRNRINNK